MAIAKIQTGDTVKITAGNYKGTTGVVTKIARSTKNGSVRVRAAVSTVENIVKYRKSNRAYNMPGQLLSTARLIDVSNLRLVDDKGTVSKVRIEESKTGSRRVYKTTGKPVTKSAALTVADEPKTEEFKNKKD